MWFVYLHIAWFSIWIALGVEYYPYGLLTMIVSLEAIFLSTLVRSVRTARTRPADIWPARSGERSSPRDNTNAGLIGLSNQILDLTKTIHELTLAHEHALGSPPAASK